MPAPWPAQRIAQARNELRILYVRQNKTIGQIAEQLSLTPTTVYERIKRLGLPILRQRKPRFNNRNLRIKIPKYPSGDLAEFIGILLGDGHLTPTQVTVTLGKKEARYVAYVTQLMRKLFGDRPRQSLSKRGDWTVYVGSTELVHWFLKNGLAHNKVKSQVRIPAWCFRTVVFKRRTLRGLIDTDGSVYRIRSGVQISFCNCSKKLLSDARKLMVELGFTPSRPSVNKIYLTRARDLQKYYREIGFGNFKHKKRFMLFVEKRWGI